MKRISARFDMFDGETEIARLMWVFSEKINDLDAKREAISAAIRPFVEHEELDVRIEEDNLVIAVDKMTASMTPLQEWNGFVHLLMAEINEVLVQ